MQRIFIIIGFLIAFSGLFFVKIGNREPLISLGALNPKKETPKVVSVSITPATTPVEDDSIQKGLEKIFGSPKTNNTKNLPAKVELNVPFTAQAPFGNWADAEQDYGCEEASLLMAVYWARGEKITPEIALREIKAMSKLEMTKFGDFHDTSINDTFELLKTYFNYDNAFIKYDIGVQDIKAELANGNAVIVPINGRLVNNIYYVPPGPFRHQIVITGYDDATGKFTANDPGTMKGGGYKYSYKTLESALMDYPTGTNEPVKEIRSAMLVVRK